MTFCFPCHNSAKKNLSVDENVEPKKTTKVLTQDYSIPYLEAPRAVLTLDSLGGLPQSFTICSTIKAPSIFENDVFEFFSILGKHFEGALVYSRIQVIKTSRGLETTYNYKRRWKELESDGNELHAFSNQWIKRCGSYDLVSGLFQIVVDGVFVENVTLPQEYVAEMPSDLSGKLVLGAYYSAEYWIPAKNKVTNVNIYSTAHTVWKICARLLLELNVSKMETTLPGRT